MNRLVFITLIHLATSLLILHAVPPPGTWELTFEDDFDGPGLDGSKWKIGTHWGGIGGQGGNNPNNVSVSGGTLKITSTTQPTIYSNKSYDYSTSEISTFRKFNQKYGYFEARMKWPSVTGLWPAFWTMPDRGNYGNPFAYNHGFLKFDFTANPINEITSAKLRLTISKFDPDVLEIDKVRNLLFFRLYDDIWSESGITWNNQPDWDPIFIDQRTGEIGVVGDVVEIDVTEFVSQEMNGDRVISIAMADTFMNSNTVRFHSRESTVEANRPQLIINDIAYEVSEDAYVNFGNPDSKSGLTNELRVGDFWGNTASTSNGGMEIDIIETLGIKGPNEITHVLHWDGYDPNHPVAAWGDIPVNNTAEFHTYGVYWDEGRIEFYVDDELTGVYADSRAKDVAAFLILSLQIGGWDGNENVSPDIDGKTMEVDYVRVWSGTKTTDLANTSIDAEGNVTLGNDFIVYGSGGTEGLNRVSADGQSLRISGNSWIKFPIVYEVTAETILEFTIEGTDVGEILGIGLDEDNDPNSSKRVFKFAGNQNWSNSWPVAETYSAGSGPVTYSIPIGTFYTGMMPNLVFVADDDGNASIDVTFSDIKLTNGSGGTVANHSVAVGSLGNGIAGTESRRGTGYLMYSSKNVFTRFSAYTGTADHIIAVFYSEGQWYADRNFGQVAFETEPGDVLLASIDFTNDTVTSLEGQSGTYEGIALGYESGDLIYYADSWNGSPNDGEFEVSGTGFTPNAGVPLPLPSDGINLEPLNSGVAAFKDRYNTGYLMYSAENVATRFNPKSGNAQHVITVTYTGGQWYYDNGTRLVAFIPRPSDILLAKVDFRNDIAISLEGVTGVEQGMQKGYINGNLSFISNLWNGSESPGQFTVIGDTFRSTLASGLEMYNAWSITQSWGTYDIIERALDNDADKDGLLNFAEFAFGLDPVTPLSPPMIQIERQSSGNGEFLNTISYPKHVEELSYVVEYSFDLIGWYTEEVSEESYNAADQMASRQVTWSSSEPAMFYRIVFPDAQQGEN